MIPSDRAVSHVESSLPPGLPLPKYRELRVEHAPIVKAQGRLLLMIAAAYGRSNNKGNI
jgi:hypothetical protein